MKQAVLPCDLHKVERLKDFVHYGHVKFFPKGTTIFMPGESLQALIFVVVGKAKVVIIKEDGTELLFFTASQNQMMSRLFDENDIMLHGITMEDTVLCFFDKEQLKKVFAEDDEIIFEMLKNYTSKVSYFKNKLSIINSASSSQKIYNLLLLLCRNVYLEKYPDCSDAYFDFNQKYTIDLGMSQKSLAEIIGVHPVTVSKVIHQLSKDNIITKKGKVVIVHNPVALAELANESEDSFEDLKQIIF